MQEVPVLKSNQVMENVRKTSRLPDAKKKRELLKVLEKRMTVSDLVSITRDDLSLEVPGSHIYWALLRFSTAARPKATRSPIPCVGSES